MRGALLFAAILLLAVGAAAATIHVPDDAPTIAAGIQAAGPGDTVIVAAGSYLEHDLALHEGLVLIGEGGSGAVIIDAQQSGRVFYGEQITGATLQGITLANGFSPEDGGGARFRACTIVFTDIRITGCAAENGGGLYASEGCQLRCIGCEISDNRAFGSSGDGGGMAIRDSGLGLIDCRLERNESLFTSGALSLYGAGVWTLQGCVIADNVAVHGGGVETEGNPGFIAFDCLFQGNRAYAAGGALNAGLRVRLERCDFVSNYAEHMGGAISANVADLSMDACWFEDNATENRGGALSLVNGVNAMIEGCTFLGNNADLGGAIEAGQSQDYLRDCTLVGNYALHEGGAGIYNEMAIVTLIRTIIADSRNGGAVRLELPSGSFNFDCCDLYGNVGGDWVEEIDDQLGDDGNISADPRFCGDANPPAPYALHDDSPCLPGNHPDGDDCGIIGAWGAGCPASAVPAQSAWKASFSAVKALY
jgi:hypothetical protein